MDARGEGGGGDLRCIASHPGGVAVLLVASCYGNREDGTGHFGQSADFTFLNLKKFHLVKLSSLV